MNHDLSFEMVLVGLCDEIVISHHLGPPRGIHLGFFHFGQIKRPDYFGLAIKNNLPFILSFPHEFP